LDVLGVFLKENGFAMGIEKMEEFCFVLFAIKTPQQDTTY
jgi:hypothetical protein